jgi:hypothetical protein
MSQPTSRRRGGLVEELAQQAPRPAAEVERQRPRGRPALAEQAQDDVAQGGALRHVVLDRLIGHAVAGRGDVRGELGRRDGRGGAQGAGGMRPLSGGGR